MNWGSERLIKKYIEYDTKLTKPDTNFNMLEDGNRFLKEDRKKIGFKGPGNPNLIDIILTAEAREELKENYCQLSRIAKILPLKKPL